MEQTSGKFQTTMDTMADRTLWHPGGRTACLIVAAAAFLAFVPTLWMDFVWDDFPGVVSNPLIGDLGNIPSFLATGIPPPRPIFYRPIVMVSLAIDRALWGLHPAGFHGTNVMLHVLCSLLVFRLSQRLGLTVAGALAGAVLFAVHPVHADAVAWIMARADLFVTAFFIGAMLAFMGYLERGGKASLVAGCVLHVLSLGSKENAVMMPVVLVVLAWMCGRDRRRIIVAVCLAAVLAACFMAIRSAVLGGWEVPRHPLPVRIATSPGLYAEYARMLLFPAGLKLLYHGLPVIEDMLSPAFIIPAVMLSALSAAAVMLACRKRAEGLGLCWVIVTLAPVAGLPAIIEIAPVADRYTYLPSAGLAVVAAAVAGRMPARTSCLVTGALAAVMLVMTWSHETSWKDQTTYLERMVREAPGYAEGRRILARHYENTGRDGMAEEQLAAAVSIEPGYADALNDLGALYLRQGRTGEARRMFERTLEVQESHGDARFNLAVLLFHAGDGAASGRHFRRLLEDGVDDPRIAGYLGAIDQGAAPGGGRSR